MKLRSLAVSAATVAAVAAGAPAASAVSTGDQLVTGVAGSTLSINAATPVVFTSLFTPGSSSSGVGTVTAASTSPTWHLSVKSSGNNPSMAPQNGVTLKDGNGTLDPLLTGLNLAQGQSVPTVSTCDSGASALAAAPSFSANTVSLTSALTSVLGSLPLGSSLTPHTVTLTNADQAIVDAAGVVLPATAITTNVSQAVGAAEQLQAGCLYQVTAVYSMS